MELAFLLMSPRQQPFFTPIERRDPGAANLSRAAALPCEVPAKSPRGEGGAVALTRAPFVPPSFLIARMSFQRTLGTLRT